MNLFVLAKPEEEQAMERIEMEANDTYLDEID